jgi:hypothetical protein
MLLKLIWRPIHYVRQAIDSSGVAGWLDGWNGTLQRGWNNQRSDLTLKPRLKVWLISNAECFNKEGRVLVPFITCFI